jgi:MSHA biogenesis protein MshP
MNPIHRTQHGFAAIAAIVLLVLLAALGSFMISISNTQQLTSAQDVQGTRAYWAARAGLEWGVGSANASSACPAASTTLTVDGFSVVVTCGLTSYSEASSAVKIIGFQSVASFGAAGSLGYIERSVSATLEK